MDLQKASDATSHKLLLAKLTACAFANNAVELI